MSEELITNIYNAFDPFQPLEPDDPVYVDCHQVRGDENIFRELGKKIIRSKQPTCQLYTGHRGVGKSTELKRLKKHLEERGFFVVYFAADQEDIDSEDAQYTDILLACTRHILEELENMASPKPLQEWLKGRWESLKGLALTEVSLEKVNLETTISQFAKLTATLKAVPSTRETIRKQVDIHSISLIDALNEFITEAKTNLKDSKLAVIADNLDRIVPVTRADGRSNHDEIFLDRCGQLRALQCHVIYTVPISLVYSNRATQVRDNYGDCQVLPMIMVRNTDNSVYEPGLKTLKELIGKRVGQFAPDASLDTEIFDKSETIERLCLASGGHVREVMQLMQTALDWTDDLPITNNAVQRAITKARNNYRNAVDAEDWQKLAEVSVSKSIPNDLDYRNLLFNRCLLEYRHVDERGEIKRWHDAHPLIKEINEFREALDTMKKGESA